MNLRVKFIDLRVEKIKNNKTKIKKGRIGIAAVLVILFFFLSLFAYQNFYLKDAQSDKKENTASDENLTLVQEDNFITNNKKSNIGNLPLGKDEVALSNGSDYLLAKLISSDDSVSIVSKDGEINLTLPPADKIDISRETNLKGNSEIVLEGDSLRIASSIARDSELHSALTLGGAADYLTLVGQNIVRNLIDLNSHITGVLPVANGGTGVNNGSPTFNNLILNGNLVASGVVKADSFEGSFSGGFAPSGDVDMLNYLMVNIGNSATDFDATGGLTLANTLNILNGGANVSGVIVATGGSSTAWNSAYSWGNHSAVGYLTASSTNTLTNKIWNGNRIDISDYTNLAGGSQIVLTGDALSIANDSIGDSQLAFNTGQNLTTLNSPIFAGLNLSGMTNGSIFFQGASGLTQDNGNLFWDDVNNRLGIGTTAPGTALEVVGSIYASGTLGASSGGILISSRGNLGDLYKAAGTSLSYYNGSSVVQGLVLNNQGNIGIGTIVPDRKLTINQSVHDNGIRIYGYDTHSSDYLDIKMRGDGSAGFYNWKGWETAVVFETGATMLSDMDFSLGGLQDFSFKHASGSDKLLIQIDNQATTVATIDGTGNVGIGTTSPGAKLDVVGGQISVGGGTSVNPSYAFGGDLDTGMFSSSANRIDFATGGIQRFSVLSNGTVVMGSASTRIIGNNYYDYISNLNGFAMDENRVAIRTNYTDRIYVNNAGNVGIGTTTPSKKLHVVGGNVQFDSGHIELTSGYGLLWGDDYIKRITGDIITIGIDNSEKVRIDSSGNVGIGTTSPSKLLHVAGQSQFDDNINLATDKYLNFALGSTLRESTAGTFQMQAQLNGIFAGKNDFFINSDSDGNASGAIKFGIGSPLDTNVKMILTNTGNVGIGTTSPTANLDMLVPAAVSGTNYFKISTAVNDYFKVAAYGGSQNSVSVTVGGGTGVNALRVLGSGATPLDLDSGLGGVDRDTFVAFIRNGSSRWKLGKLANNDFALLDANSTTQPFTVQYTTGNVGIGTTTPGAKLEVAGIGTGAGYNVGFKIDTNNNDYGPILSGYSNKDLGYNLIYFNGSFIARDDQRITFGSSSNFYTSYNLSAGRYELTDANSNRIFTIKDQGITSDLSFNNGQVFIRNDGNVGIGTTIPGAALQIGDLNTVGYPAFRLYGQAANQASRKYVELVTDAWGNVSVQGTALDWQFNTVGLKMGSNKPLVIGNNNDYGIVYSLVNDSLQFTDGKVVDTNVRMTINNAGNVGIGLTNPAYKLDVFGDANVSGTLTVGTLSATNLSSVSAISAPYFTATSAVGTSTFAGGINISGNIIPTADNTYSLGSATNMWKDVYIGPGSLYINGKKVIQEASESMVFSADLNQNLIVQTSGSGDIELNPLGTGLIQLKGNIELTAGKTFRTSNGTPIDFSDGILADNLSLAGNLLSAANLNGSLELAANGLGAVYVMTGNFGVGTTGPLEKLDVAGRLHLAQTTVPSTVTDRLYNVGGNLHWNGLDISSGGSGATQWTTSGSNIYYNGGNVGIGTMSPGAKLDVVGAGGLGVKTAISVKQLDDGLGHIGGQLSLVSSGWGEWGLYAGDTSSDLNKLFYGAGGNTTFKAFVSAETSGISFAKYNQTTLMQINNNGNVGIGTTTPGNLLQINTTTIDTTPLLNVGRTMSPGDYLPIANFGSGSTSNGGLRINSNNSGLNALTTWTVWDTTDNRWEAQGTTSVGATQQIFDTNGSISFKTQSSAAVIAGDPLTFNDTLTLLGNGNVGIGTASPAKPLDVTGYINSNSGGLSLGNNTVLYNGLSTLNFGTGAYWSSIVYGGTSVALNTFNGTNSIFNGNVGIGTATPGAKLDVVGTSNQNQLNVRSFSTQTGYLAQFFNSAGAVALGINAGGSIERPITATGDMVISNINNNSIVFRTNGGVEQMRINGSGNVGIGTTSPEAKLHVSGGDMYFDAGYKIGWDSGTEYIKRSTMGDSFIIGAQSADILNVSEIGVNIITGKFGINDDSPDARLEINNYSGGVAMMVSSSSNGNGNLFNIQQNGNVGIGTTSPYGKLNISGVPVASASYGTFSLGGGVFDGTTTGKFVGSTSGTSFAVNEASGYTGDLMNLQVGGVSKLSINSNGTIYGNQIYTSGLGFSDSRIYNISNTNNALLQLASTGSTISRNVADANPALIVSQLNASSTGDILQLKNSASTVLTVQQGGNVGIGTTSPAATLDVFGPTNAAGIRLSNLNANNSGFYAYSSSSTNMFSLTRQQTASTNDLSISSYGGIGLTGGKISPEAGSYQMYLASTGNVGIGTTSPQTKLDINGSARISGFLAPTSGAGLELFYLGGQSEIMSYDRAGEYRPIQIRGSNILLNGGNVGIGTTTPGTNILSVYQNTPAVDVNVLIRNAQTAGSYITNQANSKYVGNILVGSTQAWYMGEYGTDNFIIRDHTGLTTPFQILAGAPTNSFYIASNGNIGMGTNSPAYPLHLVTANADGVALQLESSTISSTSFSVKNSAIGGLNWGIRSTAFASSAGGGKFAIRDETNAQWRFIIDNTGNVGIGTTSPAQQLDITKSMTLTNTTSASQFGIIYKGATPFIHNFNYGNNGTVTTGGANTFIGENAGNLTMGSAATEIYHASFNSFVGYQAGRNNTTGYANVFVGHNAGYANTTGANNSFIGREAGRYNTTGYDNSFVGINAGYSNTTGNSNAFVGRNSGYANTTGSDNTFLGVGAGRYIVDGITANTTGDNSVFIGRDAKALADNDQNEIVIGYDATGLGSNSVVLGNDSITKTALRGNIGIGTVAPDNLLHIKGNFDYLAKLQRNSTNDDATALLGFAVSSDNAYEAGYIGGLRIPGGNGGMDLVFGTQTGGGTPSEKLRITGAGNVGIGTTSPGYKLDISGDIAIGVNGSLFGRRTDGVVVTMQSITASDNFNSIYSSGASYGIKLKNTANGELVTVLNSGNVGIGTTSPTNPFEVWSNGGAYHHFDVTSLGNLIINPSGLAGGGFISALGKTNSDIVPDIYTASNERGSGNGGIGFGLGYLFRLESGGGSITDAGRFKYEWTDATAAMEDSKFTIQTKVNGTMNDSLVIKDGNVGIGTTTPATALTIGDGTGMPKLRIAGAGYGSGVYTDMYIDEYSRLVFYGTASTTLFRTSLGVETDKSLLLNNTSSAGIKYSAAGNDSIYIGVESTQNGRARSVIIGDFVNNNFDYGHAVQNNPTLFVHSANPTTNEWIGFAHNQTNATIDWGKGDLLLNGGNVGIGTTSPGSKLDIVSTLAAVSGTDYGMKILPTYNQAGTAGGTDLLINRVQTAVGSGAQNLIDAQVDGVSKFRVTNAGLVDGISALYANYVNASSYTPPSHNTTLSLQNRNFTLANTGIKMLYAGTISNTAGQFNGLAILPAYNQTASTAANTDLLINRTETGVGSGAQLLIDSQVGGVSKFNVSNVGNGYFAGNVGIGTTSPGAKLNVVGTDIDTPLFIMQSPASYNADYWQIKNSVGTTLANFDKYGSFGTSGMITSWNAQGISAFKLSAYNSTGLKLEDDGGNGMFIQDGGNVGIGTTSPGASLHLGIDSASNTTPNILVGSGGNVSNYMSFSGGRGYFGYNAIGGIGNAGAFNISAGENKGIEFYVNGTNGTFLSGTKISSISAAGGFSFGSSYAGTDAGAGNMIIQGNVGIGTTSPTTGLELGSVTAGKSQIINATEGPEMAPALEAANWTGTNGWSASGGSLVKVASASTGTITPSGTFTVTAGRIYKVVFTVSASNNNLYDTIGGTNGKESLVVGTHTQYITATNNGKIIFTSPAVGTATITSLSVKELTPGTGNLDVSGRLTLKGGIYSSEGVNAIDINSELGTIGLAGAKASTAGYGLVVNGHITSTTGFIYANGFSYSSTSYLHLNEAANTASVRNSINQQNLRVYNTYTDTSNYERLAITGTQGQSVNINAETLGTGGDNLNIVLTPSGTGYTILNGNVGIGTTSPSVALSVVGAINASDNVSSYGGGVKIGSFSADIGNVYGLYTGTSNPTISAYNGSAIKAYLTVLASTGNVGIGTTAPASKLEVSGGDIRVTGGSFIDDGTTLTVPDYVFEDDYQMLTTNELRDYILQNKHLPGVPDMNNRAGWANLSLQDRDMLLLEKIEENTLYTLGNDEKLETFSSQFSNTNTQISDLILKTDSDITNLNQLQTSVDGQLAIAGQNISELTNNVENQDLRLTNSENKIAELEATLQIQITKLEEMSNQELNFAWADLFANILSIDDASGEVDILNIRDFAAEITETGMLVIKVIKEEAPAIGTAIICPAMKELDEDGKCEISQIDSDNDKLDDNTGNVINDGKSVVVKTEAVSETSKVFVTIKSKLTKEATLMVTNIANAESFEVNLVNSTEEPLVFDWWIVEMK